MTARITRRTAFGVAADLTLPFGARARPGPFLRPHTTGSGFPAVTRAAAPGMKAGREPQ